MPKISLKIYKYTASLSDGQFILGQNFEFESASFESWTDGRTHVRTDILVERELWLELPPVSDGQDHLHVGVQLVQGVCDHRHLKLIRLPEEDWGKIYIMQFL